MTFEEITEEEFRDFANKSPYKSFMQTPEIAKYREENDWTVYYLAAKYHGELRAASMLVAKPTFLGKSTFIAPGGPLLDLEDQALTEYYMKSLKKYIKSHNGYVLHISPYYELTERDRHGDKVENGFDHQNAVKNLRNLGFLELKDASQPKYMYALDIKGKTPDELMKDFKSNTRGHIRKAEKMGVKVRELKREELNIFKQITESTSKRREFEDKPLKYYEEMYDLFVPRGEAVFLVAEVEDGVSGDLRDDGSARSAEPRDDGREGACPENTISTLPLSAAMFMLYGDEVVYLFSGSDEKYMKDYNAQYELQWHMIRYASENHFKRYNFYGIHGLPKDGQTDGVYEFKKGFGGQVIEMIGTYELPIDHKFYQLKNFLKKIKKAR
ncbi:peptidoglycan bridge formation glycyltransferase FemA/FemB family protein [Candidatus Saccharibacteria bacterium]|nr:peptidoglycan bridge formation glycyltransferase FemA/FemB family protein [Candidatus Saccharibacteria bacterium]